MRPSCTRSAHRRADGANAPVFPATPLKSLAFEKSDQNVRPVRRDPFPDNTRIGYQAIFDKAFLDNG